MKKNIEKHIKTKPNQADHNVDNTIAAMIAEYSSLRNESVEAIKSRVTITNLLFGVLTAIFATVASGKIDSPYDALIAILIIPQFVKATIWLGLGEYSRSQRAGRYLLILEDKINQVTQPDALEWEHWLADEKKHMVNPYKRTGMLALIIIWLSNCFGIIRLWLFLKDSPYQILFIVFSVASIITVEVWFFQEVLTNWKRART